MEYTVLTSSQECPFVDFVVHNICPKDSIAFLRMEEVQGNGVLEGGYESLHSHPFVVESDAAKFMPVAEDGIWDGRIWGKKGEVWYNKMVAANT